MKSVIEAYMFYNLEKEQYKKKKRNLEYNVAE